MFILGLGLLGSIFLSFGCLIAAFKSLMSLTRESFNSEARLMAVSGFIGGLIASAFFGWATIVLVNKLSEMNAIMAQ
jgi:hypothetical protein